MGNTHVGVELRCLVCRALAGDSVPPDRSYLAPCSLFQSLPGGLCSPVGVKCSQALPAHGGEGLCPWHRVQVQEPAACLPGREPLTASMLAAAPLHRQKQMIGEWLVPLLWSRRGVRWELASLVGNTLSGGQM